MSEYTYARSRHVLVWDEILYQHVTVGGKVHLAHQGVGISVCGLVTSGKRADDDRWNVTDAAPSCASCLRHFQRERE